MFCVHSIETLQNWIRIIDGFFLVAFFDAPTQGKQFKYCRDQYDCSARFLASIKLGSTYANKKKRNMFNVTSENIIRNLILLLKLKLCVVTATEHRCDFQPSSSPHIFQKICYDIEWGVFTYHIGAISRPLSKLFISTTRRITCNKTYVILPVALINSLPINCEMTPKITRIYCLLVFSYSTL